MSMLAALSPLVGRWATTITMVSPADVAGEVYRAVDTYRWMPGECVLLHDVEARMGDAATFAIEIYSEVGGRIVSRSYDSTGEVVDYTASMVDGVWRVESDNQRFTSTSISATVIEGLWRLKGDSGWADWMTVRLDRVG